MSKARSPRDVCSTTMGTSGLMVLASVWRRDSKSCRGSLPTGCPGSGRSWPDGQEALRVGRPELLVARALGLVVAGRPDLVLRLGLLAGGGLLRGGLRLLLRARLRRLLHPFAGLLADDRLGLGDDEVDRLLGGELLGQGLDAAGLAQAGEQLLARDLLALGGALERVEQLLLGRHEVLGLDDGGQHGLPAQRQVGLGLGVLDELFLGLAGDLEVV